MKEELMKRWQPIIAQWQVSGLSKTEFCRHNNIDLTLFKYHSIKRHAYCKPRKDVSPEGSTEDNVFAEVVCTSAAPKPVVTTKKTTTGMKSSLLLHLAVRRQHRVDGEFRCGTAQTRAANCDGHMIGLPGDRPIYPYMNPTDIRLGFRRLSKLIYQHGGRPYDGAYYVFLNRPKTHVKIMFWDGDGMAIFYKYLAKGTFILPPGQGEKVCLDRRQLTLFLEGVTPLKIKPRFLRK